LSKVAVDLLTKMLDKNKETRIGAKSGMDEVLNHPFFKEIDF
jgi:serine/threonine protein kinase